MNVRGQSAPHQKAHSACERSRRLRLSVTVGPRGCPDCAFPSRHGHRMRLCVSVRGQNALFRKVRFSSPGQTWRHLTEKRTLGGRGHGKAHSACGPSRKSALCTSDLTEKRTLHASGHAECVFTSRWDRVGFRMRFSVTTRPQNAPLRECPGPECAFT